MIPTLLAAGAVDLATATLFASVGAALGRRHHDGAARVAAGAFRTWWWGLAVTIFVTAARNLAAGLGANAGVILEGLLLLQYAYVAALCAAVWGLLYYLVYVYTGSTKARAPLAAFYGAYFLVAAILVARMRPVALAPGKWFAQVVYADPLAGGPLVVLVLLLFLPQVVLAGLYLALVRRVEDRSSRFRVALVGGSLLGWIGLALAAPFVGLGRFEAWQAGGRLVGLAAALLVLAAYHPPAWVRRRLVVEPVPGEVVVPGAPPDATLVARARELV